MSEANMPAKAEPALRRILFFWDRLFAPEGSASLGNYAPEPGERGSISFKDGMLRFLEAASGYGDNVRGPNQSARDQIGWFVSSLFLRGQGDRPLVAVYGKKEPSRVSRFIPDSEIKHLEWDREREQLRSTLAGEPAIYSGVTLDACQFGKHLDWYLKQVPRRVSAAA